MKETGISKESNETEIWRKQKTEKRGGPDMKKKLN